MLADANGSQNLTAAADRWATVALDSGWVEQWVEGAIFPCEMVYFLARVESEGVRMIIESGRQDGYSTMILGEFARRSNVRVVSIDYEEDQVRGQRCRECLVSYPVELLVGDAFSLMGRTLRGNFDRSVALLVDGPKGWSATALVLAAAAYPNVTLMALHNLHPDSAETQALTNAIDHDVFYETHLTASESPWARLRKHERTYLALDEVARSLEKSSLGIFLISDAIRTRLGMTIRRNFMFFQPPLIRLCWRLNMFSVARRLHSGSFRVFYSRVFRILNHKTPVS